MVDVRSLPGNSVKPFFQSVDFVARERLGLGPEVDVDEEKISIAEATRRAEEKVAPVLERLRELNRHLAWKNIDYRLENQKLKFLLSAEDLKKLERNEESVPRREG